MNNERTTATAVTQMTEELNGTQYAYRRFGSAVSVPLLLLQHFTGTLDNWDPALVDPIALRREVILFDNAGVGRSSGKTATTVAEMSRHVVAFADSQGLVSIDILGFSLGGMVAQQVALDRPNLVRRLILAGTGPAGGENMSMLKPELLAIFQDSASTLGERLLRLFFYKSGASQQAGRRYLERLGTRTTDRDTLSGIEIFRAQAASIDRWGEIHGERYSELRRILQPTLVFNGNKDIMIPTINSYILSEHLPNAELLILPDSGHGALFQYSARFSAEVIRFLE